MTKTEQMSSKIAKKITNAVLEYHILKLLKLGPTTGYQICKDLRKKYPKTTTSLVYLKLNKLEQHGFITRRVVYARIDRKECKITISGERLLRRLRRQIKEMMKVVL